MTGTSSVLAQMVERGGRRAVARDTIICTSCSSSRSAISSEYFRTSSAGFGPYGKSAGVAEVHDVARSGTRSSSARTTVSPPRPLSKTPIGRASSGIVAATLAGRSIRSGSVRARRSRSATAAPRPSVVGREHDEEHVEAERVGVAQPGVEHAGVLVDVARRVEHDETVERRDGGSGSASSPTRRPSREQLARAVPTATRRRSRRRAAARSATRSVPGAAISPLVRSASARAERRARRSARLTPPTRRIAGSAPVTSTIVDSTPTAARTAVEHDVDVVAEIGAHVLRRSSGSRGRTGWPTAPRLPRRTRRAARARADGRARGGRRCRARR